VYSGEKHEMRRRRKTRRRRMEKRVEQLLAFVICESLEVFGTD
jgi:hypothetical protein